jgi:hypothetical protein
MRSSADGDYNQPIVGNDRKGLMATVVVGGHSRNIGKTSVMAGLIRALPEYHWTAFKITQSRERDCSPGLKAGTPPLAGSK